MNFSNIRQFLAPPIFENDDKTHVAYLLNIILIALLAIAMIYLVVAPIIESNPLPGLIGNAITVVVYITALILMRRGRVQLASTLFLITLWLMIALVAIAYGGVTTPAFFSYFTSIVIAGLLLSGWAAIAFAGLSIASCLGLLLAETNGMLPAPVLTTTPVMMWWVASVNFIMVAVLLFLAHRSIKSALDQARNEIAKRQLTEERLQESEEQYRQLMQESPVGIGIFDPDGMLVTVNKSWENIWGVKAEDVVGKYNPLKNELFHKIGVMPLIEQAFAGKQVHIPNIEIDPAKSNLHGRQQWMQGFAYHVKDKQGRIKNVILLSEDITERKLAEEALQKSEERLRQVVENMPVMMDAFDAEGNILVWNKECERVTGFSTEEIINNPKAMELLYPDSIQRQRMMTQWAKRGNDYYNWEWELTAKDGTVKTVAWANISDRFPVPGWAAWGIGVDVTERKQYEQALIASEERYRRMIEDQTEFIVRWRPDGTRIFVNESYCRYYGLTREEAVGSSFFSLISEEDREAVRQRVSQLSRQKPVSNDEHRVIKPDGTIGWNHWTDRAFFNEQEEVIEYQSVGRDITERKLAEEALRESEERFRSLLEHTRDAIFCYEYNPPIPTSLPVEEQVRRFYSGQLVECNVITAQFYGSERTEDVLGKTLSELFGATPGGRMDAFFKIFIRDGHRVYEGEAAEELPDGSTLYFVNNAHGVIVNGKLVRVWGAYRDITERKQAEEALERSEKHYRALIENALDIITILNSDGIINYESPSIEPTLGYKPEELVGQNVFDFVHPEDLPGVVNAFTMGSQIAGPAPPIELRFRHKDGSWHILEAVGSNLLNDPAVARIVINSRDITDRKRLEEQFRQAQRMEAIGQLTAGIAHDFNNLLTAINGFAGLMQAELPPDDPQQDSLARILRSGQRAADLVSQLLAFSRKQIIEPQILNLNTTVTEMERMLRRIIGEDIELETSLTSALWEVKVDPTQIEQIIINLAVNARDAMPKGGRLMVETSNVLLDDDYVTYHLETQPGEYVLLTISDTGTGMSHEVSAHIFEPFFTTKEQGKGTGLGLATVYGIVKQNRGHIWVYSEPKTGATFKVYLPRAKERTPALPHIDVETESLAGNETILLVEDDAEVRNLARRVLQTQGYTLLEADEGQEALNLAADHAGPIHLLLTDVIMPGMSGKQLAEKLGQMQPGLKILFMSGYTDNVIVQYGVLDPGVFLLQKPFGPTALARKVRNVLDS